MFSCNKTAPSTAPSLPTPTSGSAPGAQATLPSTSKANGTAKGQTQAKDAKGQPRGESPHKAQEKAALDEDQIKAEAQAKGPDSEPAPEAREKTDSQPNPFPLQDLEKDPAEPVKTPEERRAEAEQKFDESLAHFEKRLIKEKEILNRNRPRGAAAGGTGSAGSAGLAGSPSPPAGVAGPANPRAGKTVTGGGSGQAMGTGMHKNGGRIPPDIPDGNDDDIVARQLREAAMQEDDPSLREKLWQEYRNYKNGTGTGETSRQH